LGRGGTSDFPFWSGLLGRGHECETLSSLVAAAKAGRSQILVLRGEAGIGKTALLEFLLDRVAGCRVGRAVGVESEMELAYAGVHQLCGPYLHVMDQLPAPQRDALGTAFGLRAGNPPDRFLVGLGVLTLLGVVADELPLICVVDDAQWLDRASTQTLEFVARRLRTEPVAMVFAARDAEEDATLAGLPELVVGGLCASDAEELLDASAPGVLDAGVRERILAESRGNPLALLELPRGLSAAELVFGAASAAGATPVIHRLEQLFLRRLAPLPSQSRQLLLVAAAEPVGDMPLLWRAVQRLGIRPEAVSAAEEAGLIELRELVRFRHPLVRSAVYRSATPAERRAVHGALAAATDPDVDPDRRAWHRASAALNPDETVAEELERSAGRALANGGLAAAAAFLEQSAALTPDPAQRVRRALDGAQVKVHAGAFDDAQALLAAVQAAPLDDIARARIDLVRAEISLATNGGDKALPLLLAAARGLQPLDAALARDTYLAALSAALFAGRLASGPDAREVAEAVRETPSLDPPRKGDALLDGLAVLFTDGYTRAAPVSHRAVQAFAADEPTLDEALRFSWLAAAMAASLWDDARWDVLTRRHLEVVRRTGALSILPLALNTRSVVHLFTGHLTAAASLVDETRSVTASTGSPVAPYGEIGLAAVRGREEEAEPLIERSLHDVVARGEGVGVTTAQWARAVLYNGLGRCGEAVAAAKEAAADPRGLGPPKWALAELVEAGARSGQDRTAAAALEQLSAMTRASGTDWALGIEASRRALLREGATADALHREAIERLGGTLVRVELARAQLLYGEWLRREGRRADARVQLRTAHEALTAMGVEAFADRARRELLATGETVRRRSVETTKELTSQETQIARLVADGLTNPEIGVELYISPRTVEWHLRKIFAKLGVNSRRQLRRLSLRDPVETLT
jgi:DNA-binding CsgD family transcriptional regulator